MAARPYPEVIDLLSSSDDEDEVIYAPRQGQPLSGDQDANAGVGLRLPMAGAFPADDDVEEVLAARPAQDRHIDGGMFIVIDGDEVFIPDEEPQAAAGANATVAMSDLHARNEPSPQPVMQPSPSREFTVDDCLQHVLEIFPDISHDHVRKLYASFDHEGEYEVLAGRARLDNIVEQLVSATSYPKEEKGKLKRKRENSIDGTLDVKKWQRDDREPVPVSAKGAIAAICKADFPQIPRNHISLKLVVDSHLFQAYAALAKDVDDSEEGNCSFGRGRAARASAGRTADADTIVANCGHPELAEELAAVRQHVTKVRAEREAAKAKKLAEAENLKRAIAAGEATECSVCYEDLPMNRAMHCDGETAHFICFDCAETYIKTEVGDSRCRVLCTAGCGAGFAPNQLNLLQDKQLLEKLAQIQQEQDIREAGLADLEECPFCDFKAIMPPVEEDFEFRCANPECEKVSCRRCKTVSHVPISCEQYAKDNKLSTRHQIEEAMTAALVRSCNKCKKQFIKESGCNKMHCMSCNTLQCYVCSATVTNYDHFDQRGPGSRTVGGAQSKKCPLYDNVEERHEREVKEAEAKARAEVVNNNPDVSAEDLEIKVSDAVKKAENDRMRRGGQGMAGYLGGAWLGGGMPDLADLAFVHGRGRRVGRENGDDLGVGDLNNLFGLDGGNDEDEDGGEWADLHPGRAAAARAGNRRHGRLGQAAAQQQRMALMMQQRQQIAERRLAQIEAGQPGAQANAAQQAQPQQDPGAFAQRLANVAAPLRGYIPVLLGGAVGQQQPQQRPDYQARPAVAQPPAPAQRALDVGFNDMFDDIFGAGRDAHGGQQQQQPGYANAQRDEEQAAHWDYRIRHGAPNARARDARGPYDHRNFWAPGAFADVPGPAVVPAPPRRQLDPNPLFAPHAQQPPRNHANPDPNPLNARQRNELEVLRNQHERIQRERVQRQEQRQANQQEDLGRRLREQGERIQELSAEIGRGPRQVDRQQDVGGRLGERVQNLREARDVARRRQNQQGQGQGPGGQGPGGQGPGGQGPGGQGLGELEWY